MRYLWKALSLISGLLVVLFSIPTAIAMRVHLWLCRKADPNYNPFAEMMKNMTAAKADGDAEQMGKALADMMRAMVPAVVDGAKASVDKVMEKHNRPFAWAESPGLPVVNPVPPRIPNMPATPTPPSHQTSGRCCGK